MGGRGPSFMSGGMNIQVGRVSRAKQASGARRTAAGVANYMLRHGPHREAGGEALAVGEGNLPNWAKDASAYFAAEDRLTIRKNARLSTTLKLALPRAVLTFEEHQQLIEAFMLLDVGTDRRGNRRLATREQLCAHPDLAVEALAQKHVTFGEAELLGLFGDDENGRRALHEARQLSGLGRVVEGP